MSLRDLLHTFREFLTEEEEFLWLVDDRVYLGDLEDSFITAMDASDADLLGTHIRTREDDPEWTCWSSLQYRRTPSDRADDLAMSLPLCRLSRPAVKAVLDGFAAGWEGFEEALVPTVISRSGLNIEEIGGTGSFTPQERRGRWYDDETWHWEGCSHFKPGHLHFPVLIQDSPPAPRRLDLSTPASSPRILFAVPAGGGSKSHVETMLQKLHREGVDSMVFIYDDSKFMLPPETRVVREPGHKWQFACRHLHPSAVSEYDYLFFWDDDLGFESFDPVTFVGIMRTNRLSMAQPAITSRFGLSHEITRRHRCETLRLVRGSGDILRPVGRLTNFVEIMAPVFTREAWEEFYSYLSVEMESGWGYDHIPLERRGIIDAMSVEHLRPVGSIHPRSEGEFRNFVGSQGFVPRYAQAVEGLLFEVISSGTRDLDDSSGG